MEPFITDELWWNLQGIAISQSNNQLYVSDYITGIDKVDLNTGEVEAIFDDNQILRGADGIYLNDGELLLLQNGTYPKRIARI